MKNSKLKIGIDASRNRSGGAVAYLLGILRYFKPEAYPIKEIHIWGSTDLLKKIPDYVWLTKHTNHLINGSIFQQIYWQAFLLKGELLEYKCDILFAPDAASFCKFYPMVTVSQDMLAYDKKAGNKYPFGLQKLRIFLLRLVQNSAFKRAAGVIFLSKFASNEIQKSCGKLVNSVVVPHGVNDIFFSSQWSDLDRFQVGKKIQFLYVSNAEIYKNQWHVIKAVAKLRNQGMNAYLLLIGGGVGLPQEMINNAIQEVDGARAFISQKDFLPNYELPKYILQSDVFVFASGCENLPITLLEGMATGVPIASSNYGPMPEALQDGGVYFDPENSDSIAEALKLLVSDKSVRASVTERALDLSRHYKWRRCSGETWNFISKTTASIISRGVGNV